MGILCAGIDVSAIRACVDAALDAFASARQAALSAQAAAALHNERDLKEADEDGEGAVGPDDAPWVLLPMRDHLLIRFVNRLHSDR